MGAGLPAARVSVLPPDAGFGFQRYVTPLGRPATLRVTLPVNPPEGVTVMVLVPAVP